eukprot:CAMPEP_0171116782 /NCGR_PEP_ID=MMETSP0766_2-20121228/91066_1 /TAXON_ID=439317 /ORGANISM="Gambierdiscus australes, Strain CAWD 149" /LENGTH=194 /DNA_ID=CAMNT_0011579243 /DNA_START=34 /DNA_END=618 /DNA_ORIENTATION=-
MEREPHRMSDEGHLVWGSSEQDSSYSGAQGDPSSATESESQDSHLQEGHEVFASGSSSSERADSAPVGRAAAQQTAASSAHEPENDERDATPARDGDDEGMQSVGDAGADLNDEGSWSLGAAKHDDGTCRPCFFSSSPVGCKNGADCRFCHLSHRGLRRQRPCKERRVRYKKSIEYQQRQATLAMQQNAMYEDY